jgi:hypothetical protein
MNIPLIPQDKANHAVYGLVAYLAVALLCVLVGHAALAPYAGLAVGVLMGAVKEAKDYSDNRRAEEAGLPKPHGVEFNDFLATSLGTAGGFVATLLPQVPSWLKI